MGFLGTGFLPEIINAYGGLRASMRMQMDRNVGEERLLALVAYGCFVVFLSFIPRLLATDLSATPDQSIAGGIIMWFFVVMFFFPLVLYGVGALSHLIAKPFGGSGPFFGARHALFWMLTVLSPLLIVKGMLGSVFIQIGGELGESLLAALNIILALAVLRIWGAFLAETEGFSSALKVSLSITTCFALIFAIIYMGAT
ncbi:MAG: hypothetical protein ACTSRN_03710 [Alphaproteobacteria bacterium]